MTKMNKHLERVLQWQDIFGQLGHIVPYKPICIDEETMLARMEFMYDGLRKYSIANNTNSVKDVLSALIDLQHFLYDMVVVHGLQDVFDREFDKVHQENMGKPGPDDKVYFREDGKVLNIKNDSSPLQEPALEKSVTESLIYAALRESEGSYELIFQFSEGRVAARIKGTNQDVSKQLIHLAFLIEQTIANRSTA